MNPRYLIAQLRAIVHAPPYPYGYMYTAADRQRARDALVTIHAGMNR